jgi:hypothetical protein
MAIFLPPEQVNVMKAKTMKPESKSPEKLLELEKNLVAKIIIMLGTNFDRWKPGSDMKEAEELMSNAHLTAQGIASKLIKGIEANDGKLNPKSWRKLVETASRDAIIEVEDSLVPIGTNASFRECVTTVTEICVAPPGSQWALAVKAKEEERNRRRFEAMGMSPQDIERSISEFR